MTFIYPPPDKASRVRWGPTFPADRRVMG